MGSQRVRHDWSDWAHVQTLKNNNEKHSSLSYKYGLGRGDTGWVPYAIFSGRGFPGGSDSKVSACNAGDPGLIPGLGRSPGEGNSNLLQHSCLKIPWTDEPDRLESMGSQRVRHDWATSLSLYEITRLNGNCHISAPSKQETQRTMTSFLFGSCESRELPFCSKYSIRKQPPWREKPPGATENSEINSGFLTRRQSSSRCLRRRVKSINFKLCYLKVHVATSGVTIHQIETVSTIGDGEN